MEAFGEICPSWVRTGIVPDLQRLIYCPRKKDNIVTIVDLINIYFCEKYFKHKQTDTKFFNNTCWSICACVYSKNKGMPCFWKRKAGGFQDRKTCLIVTVGWTQVEVKYGSCCNCHILLLNSKSLCLSTTLLLKHFKCIFYLYQITFFLLTLNRKLLWIIPLVSCVHSQVPILTDIHTRILCPLKWCKGENSLFNCNSGQRSNILPSEPHYKELPRTKILTITAHQNSTLSVLIGGIP